MKKLVLCLLVLLFASFASASYITMSTTTSVKAVDNNAEIDISTVNKGDESAHNVQFVAKIGEKIIVSDIKNLLNVNERFEWKHSLEHDFDMPGSYALTLTTNYQDANAYPFSAISMNFVNYQENVVSEVFGTVDSIELGKKSKLKLKIKNNGNTPKDVKVTLHAPKELSIMESELSVSVDAGTQKELTTSIESFSALPGSSYVVFAVMEYDEAGRHYANSASGIIRVIEQKRVFLMPYWLIISTIVVLTAFFILLQFKGKKKR